MRKTGTVFVSLLLLLGLAFAVFAPTEAQDDTGTRLSTLETRVAAQATQIAAIEAALTSGGATSIAAPPAANDGDAVTVSGVGGTVSGDFVLAAGRYQVTATWETGNFFIAHLWGASGTDAYLFNEYISDGIGGASSVIYTAPANDTYFVEVSNNDGPWSIVFTPR